MALAIASWIAAMLIVYGGYIVLKFIFGLFP
jgi:hypothetical protein